MVTPRCGADERAAGMEMHHAGNGAHEQCGQVQLILEAGFATTQQASDIG
jgi:hypothetical protein